MRMFTIFFNHQGPVAVDVSPANSTTTGSYYAKPSVVQEISSQCPNTTTQNVLLFHNNASPHKTRALTQYLEGQKNPILAPSTIEYLPCRMQLLAHSPLEWLTSWEEVIFKNASSHILRAVTQNLEGQKKKKKSESCPIHCRVPTLQYATSGSSLSWMTH